MRLRLNWWTTARRSTRCKTPRGRTLGQRWKTVRWGGLGLHLVRTMMDEMGYQYADGKNRLTLVIRRT